MLAISNTSSAQYILNTEQWSYYIYPYFKTVYNLYTYYNKVWRMYIPTEYGRHLNNVT